MKSFRFLTFLGVLSFAALRLTAHHDEKHKEPSAVAGYPLHGVVTQVLADKKLVLIKHEEIPGFMKAMTMAFHVPDSVFPHLTAGTGVVATMLPKQNDGWHLTAVRIVAAPGSALHPGIAYRVILDAGAEKTYSGKYAFTAGTSGDWRVCVSQRPVWVDLIPAGGQPVASKACTHANPEGFAKGPLYALEAAKPYEVRLTKAPTAEVDVLILSFNP